MEFIEDIFSDRGVLIDSATGSGGVAHSTATARNADCPFCPGNEEMTPPSTLELLDASGAWSVRVFQNRFPILDESSRAPELEFSGIHEVIIEGATHDRELEHFTPDELAEVVGAWSRRHRELSARLGVRFVLLFRNAGGGAGASLSHPHSQIIALPIVPPRVEEKLTRAARFMEVHGECLFCEEIRRASRQDRVIFQNDLFVAIAPPAPRLPYEAWIFPRHHANAFDPSAADRIALGAMIAAYLRALRRFASPAPYNMCLHAPPCGFAPGEFHWHFEFLPRMASVADSEWGAGFYRNPISPAQAAGRLRENG